MRLELLVPGFIDHCLRSTSPSTEQRWSSGPGKDEPPRIDPGTVSIADVLGRDAGEQERD